MVELADNALIRARDAADHVLVVREGAPGTETIGKIAISDFAQPISDFNAAVAAVAWSRTGNTGTNPATDFVGTFDNTALVFKTNNLRRLVIGTNGNIGINLSTLSPGQLLHLGDGNILLEGGGETAMLFKLGATIDGVPTSGPTHPNAPFVNPIFQIGRVIKGGDGAPQFRWMYTDDGKPERVVFELDSEGILSSVRQSGVRGSHFEAHRSGDTHPLFRLNSFPSMQLQMGNGGSDDTDISIIRSAAQTGALQYGPPTAQVTAAQWSPAGLKVSVGGLTFPNNSVQTVAAVPGGVTSKVQFNNSGTFSGASDVEVEGGQLRLPTISTPTAPAAGGLKIFSKATAGRVLPTVLGPTGLEAALQPLLARNRLAWVNPLGDSTTVSAFGITLALVGTATIAGTAVTNIHTQTRRVEYAVTTAAVTAIGGWRSAARQFWRGNSATAGGFFFVCRFGRGRGVAANATLRGFTGLTSTTAAPTDVEPSTNLNDILGVGCDSTDTNYQIMHRTGTGTTTKVDTGFAKGVADNTEMYELVMYAPPNSDNVQVTFIRLSDNAIFNHTITTSLPANTTLMSPRGQYSVGGTSSVIGYSLGSLYIETFNN